MAKSKPKYSGKTIYGFNSKNEMKMRIGIKRNGRFIAKSRWFKDSVESAEFQEKRDSVRRKVIGVIRGEVSESTMIASVERK